MNRLSSLLTIFFMLLGLGAGAETASRHGDDVTTHLRQARSLRTRSRADNAAAIAEYHAALRRDPANLEAQRGLARALRDRGAEEQALPYLREVARRSGDGVDDARLAWALFRVGRWAEAADAFATARQHGQNDPETARGNTLAATAARAALNPPPGTSPPTSDAAAETPSGWRRPWTTLLNATGFITDLVQRLLLAVIAVLIAGAVAIRAWGAMMGNAPPREEGGMPLRQWRGLRVNEIATGRSLGRVRQVIYDPKLARVVGFQIGGRWRWKVLPMTAARGVGPAGLLVADAAALVRGEQAGELGVLARAGVLPLGSGNRLKRVVTEEGALLAFTRAHRLRVDGATGQMTFEVSPSRFHDAWRVTLSALQFGPIGMDWLLGRLLDGGLELLPGRISARLRLPVPLVRAADRDVVIVSGEATEWIERHFRQLEADAQARLEQVKEGVGRARPVMEAGVAKARPVLEKARDTGVALARRSAESVVAGVKKGAARSGEASEPVEEVSHNSE